MTSDVHKSKPWDNIPDFTFYFYHPWHSFVDNRPPMFRTAKGEEVVADRSLGGLVHLGSDAAKLLNTNTSGCTIEDWRGLIVGARELLAETRRTIPRDQISFVDPDGAPITEPVSIEDVPSESLVKLLTELLTSSGAPSEGRFICKELWCLVCFEFIDSAVLAQMHDDAGDGVSALLGAQNALQQAQRLAASPPEPSMAIRGAIARHASTNRVREWVTMEWRAHRSEYGNNKSEFSRHYVRRVQHEFGVTITEKQMREVWLRDTPPASKPACLPADG